VSEGRSLVPPGLHVLEKRNRAYPLRRSQGVSRIALYLQTCTKLLYRHPNCYAGYPEGVYYQHSNHWPQCILDYYNTGNPIILTLLRFRTAANRTASKPFNVVRIPSMLFSLFFSCCARDGSRRLSDVARVILEAVDDVDCVKRYSEPRYCSGA
jgi:hypothetical protein